MTRGVLRLKLLGRRVGGAACFDDGGEGGEAGSSDERAEKTEVEDDGEVGERLPLRDDLRRKSLSFIEDPRENMLGS